VQWPDHFVKQQLIGLLVNAFAAAAVAARPTARCCKHGCCGCCWQPISRVLVLLCTGIACISTTAAAVGDALHHISSCQQLRCCCMCAAVSSSCESKASCRQTQTTSTLYHCL
jgi:hypothetical protein